jgi:ubiquinone/menaquinone biosynthesis C-methylase UbiE
VTLKQYEELGEQFSQENLLNGYHHHRRLSLTGRYLRRLKPQRVLDVGCGDGVQARFLASPGQVVGLDLSLNRLRRALDVNPPPFQAMSADVSRLPFRDESFDAVVCGQLIEHLTAPDVALAEMARVLRPGGHVLIDTPSKTNVVDALFKLFLGKNATWGLYMDPTHVAFYDKSEVLGMLRRAGFDRITVRGAPTLRYNLPLLRRLTWRRRGWFVYRLADLVLGSIPVLRSWGAIQLFVARKP